MSTSTRPRAHLEELGLAPKKSFGQNFLTDNNIAIKIATYCCPDRGESVVELGAGLGALTAPLLDRAGHVIAVERDRDLVPALAKRFEDLEPGRLRVLEADAASVDYLGELSSLPKPWVLAGNLPYQITGALLESAVRAGGKLERCVFLVQLEVANRLAAPPGNKIYGALSVFTQAVFKVERVLVVNRSVFYPQPRVDSAVVLLRRRDDPVSEDAPFFRSLVKTAFGQRRKQLRNSWRGVGVEAARLEEAAIRADINLDDRGERLSVADFARMARELDRP